MGSRRKSFCTDTCVVWCELNVYNVLILVGLRVVSGLYVVVELNGNVCTNISRSARVDCDIRYI